MRKELEALKKGAALFDIELSEKQTEQFYRFYEQMVETNKYMNLTGITQLDEVIVKHFLDSLAVSKAVSMEKVKKIIDVGTGAGFPGIPLKIAYPDLEVCLLDSLKKRIGFLEEVCRENQLQKVETLHGRAEDYAKNPAYREKFDLCVSRAVANLATLAEYCLPYVEVGGYFVSYKSGNVDNERKEAEKAIEILGGKIKDVIYFTLPETEIERSLVVIEKGKETPGKYPRKAGMPAKEPLK